jgi:uncharacterized protein (DUF427 family)
MSSKTMLVPGPDHPISIDATGTRVTVRAGGRTIADGTSALTLREGRYPPVFYIPRDAIDMTRLEPSTTTSHCPYKGEASYFSLVGGPADVAWGYERPHPAVASIAGHLAFYPDRVDAIEAAQA